LEFRRVLFRSEDVLPSETTVIFEVSEGPETETVPDVLGLDRDEAVSALEAAGFKVTVEETHSDDVAEHKVISQSPEAGEDVKKESTVKLVVSLGDQKSTRLNSSHVSISYA